jgi:hypothetical protein
MKRILNNLEGRGPRLMGDTILVETVTGHLSNTINERKPYTNVVGI